MARAPRNKKVRPTPVLQTRAEMWQRRLLLLRGTLLVVAALFVMIFGLLPGEADFTVNAQTQQLQLTLRPEDRLPGWGKPAGAVGVLDGKPYTCKTADFALDEVRNANIPIRISIVDSMTGENSAAEEAATQSPFVPKTPILVASFNEGERSIGRLTCDGIVRDALPSFSLLFRPDREGDGLVVPFLGLLRLGGDVAAPVSPDPPEQSRILLGGTLTVRAMAWPAKTGRAETEVVLNAGDILTFVGRDDVLVPSAGIVRTEASALESSTLHVVAQGGAIQAKIDSTYRKGVTAAYAPTFWARIQAMGEWAALIALATLAVAFLDLVKDYFILRYGARDQGEGQER